MQLLFMAIFAAVIVVADQLVKFWTVANIALYEHLDFIPGILGLTYVQNTGAAFSALEGARWLFVLVFLVLTVAMIYEYFFKRMPFTALERWCIAAVYAGGLGNVIDRVRLGYVVDMFATVRSFVIWSAKTMPAENSIKVRNSMVFPPVDSVL